MVKIIKKRLYAKIVENIPICCVDMLIIKDKKVLLIKRKNKPLQGKWCIPGGRVFKNESLVNATLRKAFDETGLKVKLIKQFGVYEFFSKDTHFKKIKSGAHAVDIVFLAVPLKNQEVHLDKDHLEYCWTNKILKEYPLFPKKILRDYFNQLR